MLVLLGLSVLGTACSSAGDNVVSGDDLAVSSASQDLTIGKDGISCDAPEFELKGLPKPFFPHTISYTATNAVGDATDVYAPKVAPGLLRVFGKLPAVVVLQGGSVDKSQYANFATRLARHGYVVAVPHHLATVGAQTGPFTSPRVLNQGFEFLKSESATDGNPIEGLVDPAKLAVVGHSLGGAQAFFAVNNTCTPPLCAPGPYAHPPELLAAIGYGTNTKARPPATGYTDINSTGVAVAHIHGSQDNVAKIVDARATYALLEPAKAFFRVNGTTHYGITNDTNSGAQPDVPQTLPQDEGVEAIADTTALWFGIHVKLDGIVSGSALSCFSGTRDGVVTIEATGN